MSNESEVRKLDRNEWLSQAKRGILEFSILLLIEKKAMYGYELISTLNRWEVLSTAEGTVYPLLRRLEKENLIESSWRETTPGIPPRKYYALTRGGTEMLRFMNLDWLRLVHAIAQINSDEEVGYGKQSE